MAFDLETWRTAVRERMTNWRQRMQEVGVESVYGALCGMTLWPVAEAAKGGDWSALMALAGVLGSVGGNLVANRIQKWEDEVDAAHQIAQEVATEPDLREAFDKVLQTLETFTHARNALSEDDRHWFAETLRTELTQLGNLSLFANTVIFADHVTVNHYAMRDPKEALTIYCRHFINKSRHLSLRGLDIDASDASGTPRQLDLTQVYIDLLTTTSVPVDSNPAGRTRDRQREEPRETRPLTVLEAVRRNRHVVILGDPGAGKSTFLTYLALGLAGYHLEPEGPWRTRLSGWEPREMDALPIAITLRDFARSVPQRPPQAEPQHLWKFIVDRLEARTLGFAAEPLLHRLDSGQVIVLLDGLDEIPNPKERVFIRDAVAEFAERHPLCRFVVTCRTLSYQDPAWKLHGFPDFTLAPFNGDQINRFIVAWYQDLARVGSVTSDAVAGLTRRLQEAVRRADLWRLASNPLLLTAMALVHAHKGQLPDARALLYEETIDILLWRWEQVKINEEETTPRLHGLLTEAGRVKVELEKVLWRLAFEAHRHGGSGDDETVADISEPQLEKALTALHPNQSKDWAGQVIKVMRERAGLLLERSSGVYTFPHRTFQEYLAGVYLSTQPNFPGQATPLAAEGALWREVILLAVGRLVHRDADTAKPLALAAELCPTTPRDGVAAWRQVWIAGDVLREIGQVRVADSDLGQPLTERVSRRLVSLLQGSHLSPVERAAAARTLGDLGDPRFRGKEAFRLPDDQWVRLPENRTSVLGFVEIPAGTFIMGEGKEQHHLILPTYYIGCYPVTVAQYRQFEATGQDGALANHPVVNITWHDAVRYCQWLTERLREWSGTPVPLATLLKQGWQVTLPSEAEWEKAARGTEGLVYPWGNHWREDHDNTVEARIEHPSAVGCFPRGASPYGCLDMAGNVWEWTRSLWGKEFNASDFKYPYDPNDGREQHDAPDDMHRVLRGGSCWYLQRDVRCAYRLRNLPRARGGGIGFRLVVRP